MRFEWTAQPCEPEAVCLAQARHACSLGLPFVTQEPRGSLAVAGGSPSLLDNLDKLKGFDEVWGVNRTAQWLCERGIPATFYTIDPQYMPGMTGVERAILSSCAHPRIFEELQGKDVRLFHTHRPEEREEFVSEGGPSSVCRAVPLAVHMGFSSVTFFGCEGSFGETTHAYPTDLQQFQLIIRAGGEDYATQPDFQMQCEYLAPFLRDLPEYFREESGGLLRAMTADPDWSCVALSRAIAERALPDGLSPEVALGFYQKEAA